MAATAEKIYKCGHCGSLNDTLESLKQHMVSVHMPSHQPVVLPAQPPQAEPQVEASSNSLNQLTHHATQPTQPVDVDTPQTQLPAAPNEPKPGRFKCGHCGIIVGSMDELKSHMLSDHVKDSETAKELSNMQTVPEKVKKFQEKSMSSVDTAPLDDGNDDEQPANKVELNFNVMIPDSELHIFPRHVEPALYFTCKYCDFKNKQYKSVSNHVTACHPKKLAPSVRAQRQEELKGLDLSELEAVSDQYGSRSRSRTSRPQPYPCGYCNLSFETQVDQDIHQRCHIDGSKAMRCCFCQRDAPEHRPWKMLYRHIVTLHPGNLSPKHLCKYCGVACMFPHNLKIHLKSEHGVEEEPDLSDSVTCEHCHKTFKHSSYLKYHLVIRHGIGTAEEKAKITAQSQRKKEQKIVNKKHKPMMTCKLCPYQTNDQYRLRTHTEVVHQGVKRHKCDVCNTAFSDYSTLRRHMWRHRDTKPYSCQFCGFTCIQSTQIKSHYKNKHGMGPVDAKKLIRHINGPRHNISQDGTQELQQIQQQQIQQVPQAPQQVPQQQIIHQQQQPQHPHHQAIVHQVHQIHPRTVDVHVQGTAQQPPRTYTLYNEQGMEYTDIQALADAAEGLLAAEQIVIATS